MEGFDVTKQGFDEATVQLDILTRRDGLLARAGHDLRLRASRLRVWCDGAGLHARVVAAAVEPICARVGERDAPGLLGDADLRRIGQNLQGEVLRSRRFDEIVFDAPVPAAGATFIDGALTLCGVRRPLRLFIERRGGKVYATASLVQSAFGIEPFSTMLGAIRVRDEVEVEISAPAALLEPVAGLARAADGARSADAGSTGAAAAPAVAKVLPPAPASAPRAAAFGVLALALVAAAACANEVDGEGGTVTASGHAWVFGPGGGSLTGAEVRALDPAGVAVAGAATVVGDDAGWRLDGLPRDRELSFELRKEGYQTTQTATLALTADVERVTFQVPSLAVVDVLAGLAEVTVDPALCQIATTITRRGHSLYDGTGTHGEPDAVAAIAPAATAGDGPIYFNLVKYDTIFPDRKLKASSHDGGVLWVNAAPGRYLLTATKPGASIRPVTLDCRAGVLANASPPWGLQVVEGGLEPKKPGEKGPFD